MRVPRLSRLNAERKARDLKFLRQMIDEGVDIEIPEVLIPVTGACPLQIKSTPGMSFAFNMGPLTTGYVLDVSLAAQDNLTLLDYEITTPFHDVDLCYVPGCDTWKFGSTTYRVNDVLNDLFGEPLPMTKGTVRHGILLALGTGELPKDVKAFDVTILFVDSLDRQVTENIPVVKQVWAGAPKWVPLPPGRGRGLYDDNVGSGEEGTKRDRPGRDH